MNNSIKYLNPQNKPMTAAGVGCTRLELWLVDLPKPDNETHVQYGVRPATPRGFWRTASWSRASGMASWQARSFPLTMQSRFGASCNPRCLL